MVQQKKKHIVHVPNFTKANPYQKLWVDALDSEVDSNFINKKTGVFPFFNYLHSQREKVAVLHLHWLNPFIKTRSNKLFFLSAVRLVLDLFLVKMLRVEVVWTIHNQDVHDSPIKPATFAKLKWCILKLVNKIVLLNQQDVETLKKEYPFVQDKVFYIPHGNYKGVYLEQSTVVFPELKSDKPVFTFLFFGLVRQYKGVQQLMEVWEKFERDKKNVRLVIAGEFRDESFRRAMKSKVSKLDSVILIDRFIDNQEVYELFTLSDAVTLPFLKINNSGSLILALTFNKPVIAPLFPVVKEYLDLATTYCYSVEEQDGLEKALEKIYNQRDTINKENIKNQNRKLDWELLKPTILEMYYK